MPHHVLSCRSHTPSPAPDAAQTQHNPYPDMKLPWGWRSFDVHSWFVVLCCPDLAPTPPLSRTESCPWSLQQCLHPTDSTSTITFEKPCTCGLRNSLWGALTAVVQPDMDRHRLTKPCHSLAKPGKTSFLGRGVGLRARHLKLVLTHLIWFISGFRRSINDCAFLLWCFCLNLSINTPPNHCSTKKRGQRATAFPRYSTWDYSAPSWKGDEKRYSAMRTAPLSVCLGLKSNGDVSQMHHCCNNGALILCSERNGFWEDLCLKPTKINTDHSSGRVGQESLPWQGTATVNLFDFKEGVWFCQRVVKTWAEQQERKLIAAPIKMWSRET